MEKFTAFNPVQLHFGKDVTDNLGKNCAKQGESALLVYGGGSIKQNGIYERVVQELQKYDIKITEFCGIKPNPISSDVDKAAQLAKNSKVDFIVAVGGGSVIDSSKIIALCATGDFDAWSIMKGIQKPTNALPLNAVLTLAATGTEMNPFAVLQNEETREKIGFGNPNIFPKHSYLDPAFTLSVPANYTAYGIVDLIAHSLEAYFGKGEAPLSDKIVFSILREAIECGTKLMNDLSNYEMRERILWASTLALNGSTVHGKVSGDWGVHDIGHIFSFLFDSPHGATLSIAYPAWLKHHKEKVGQKIALLGKEVFGTSGIDDTIKALESFFTEIKSPVRLSELNLPSNHKEEALALMTKNKVSGYYHLLSEADYPKLLELMA